MASDTHARTFKCSIVYGHDSLRMTRDMTLCVHIRTCMTWLEMTHCEWFVTWLVTRAYMSHVPDTTRSIVYGRDPLRMVRDMTRHTYIHESCPTHRLRHTYSNIRMGLATHAWVMSHIHESFTKVVNESSHTKIDESCPTHRQRHTHLNIRMCLATYEWVMAHMNESWHIWMSHGKYQWVMPDINESCHISMTHVTYQWIMSHINESCHKSMSHITYVLADTTSKKNLFIGRRWRRPTGCHKLQVIFRKRATTCRALLQKMTYKDTASYGRKPPHSKTFEPHHAKIIIRYRSLLQNIASFIWLFYKRTHLFVFH